jgi:DNA-binding transcriptional MerR regulator
MRPSLAIGDFSRATHLSVKMLRHYHRIGLLEPADVDPDTGHRRYTTEQIPTAQVIRRFRALEMPLEEIQAVIAAPDLDTRNELIAAHLDRLEENLAKTQEAAASLRDLLRPPSRSVPAEVGRRSAAAAPAVAVTEVIDVDDALSWYQGALGELYATLAAQGLPTAGPGGAIYSNDFFAHERGLATIFVPHQGTVRPTGRVTSLVVPAVELATTVHTGPHTADIDRAYGSLATYVTQHAIAVDGPIREYYLVGQHETSDESQWRTEIGWPIFQTGRNADPAR